MARLTKRTDEALPTAARDYIAFDDEVKGYGLIAWPRNEHGGGHFRIIIRRGKRIELSGIVGIGVPRAALGRR
jgi:hypothetical protein